MIAANRHRTIGPAATNTPGHGPGPTPGAEPASIGVLAKPLQTSEAAPRRPFARSPERTFANAASAPGRPLHDRHVSCRPRPGRDPSLQPPAVRDGAAHGDRADRQGGEADHRLQGRRADEFWVRGHMPDYPSDAGRAHVRGGRPALELLLQGGRPAGDRLRRLRGDGGRPVSRPGPPGRPARCSSARPSGCTGGTRSSTSRASSARTWSSTARSWA